VLRPIALGYQLPRIEPRFALSENRLMRANLGRNFHAI
jgi:hypothetical protein